MAGSSKCLLPNIGAILWKREDGGGGLGVHVRAPGLVKPSSLVSSAVDVLVLLQVEVVDIPLRGDDEFEDSSTGDVLFE